MTTTSPPAPVDIATIVRQVIAELSTAGSTAAPQSVGSGTVGAGSLSGAHGIFSTVDEAVRAAQEAFTRAAPEIGIAIARSPFVVTGIVRRVKSNDRGTRS